MGNNDDNEPDLFDGQDQTIGRDGKVIASEQKVNGRATIKGRPNIDEIVSRNEEQEKQERKLAYKTTGIIILFIIAVMLLIYFFS